MIEVILQAILAGLALAFIAILLALTVVMATAGFVYWYMRDTDDE